MIEIPVHNSSGEKVADVSIDEQSLGGEVRPALLKQAYVRYHANRRIGAARTKNRADTAYSTRKLYRQKGTGNARRGSAGTNIMRKGGMAFAKRPKSWRQDMPAKMRRLANVNAILAKAVDGEIRIIDSLSLDSPSTRRFQQILKALDIDRTCLLALEDVRGPVAKSAANIENITLTQIDRLNAFDLLRHRFVLVEREAFEQYLQRAIERLSRRSSDKRKVKEAAA